MPDTGTSDIQDVLNWVMEQTDRAAIEKIIQAGEQRLSEIEHRVARLLPNRDRWQCVFVDKGVERRIDLGKRLTPTEALEQYNVQPPKHEDFALPFLVGKEMLIKDPKKIGWWTDEDNRLVGYFEIDTFRDAQANWRRHAKYAKDPLALTYGIEWKGVKLLREIEKRGYSIVLP